MTALDACYRAYRAWCASEPQLFLTDEVLWPDAVEPADRLSHRRDHRDGGLAVGAEPSRDRGELTAETSARLDSSFAAPLPYSLISPERQQRVGASNNTSGPGAVPGKDARPARRRSV